MSKTPTKNELIARIAELEAALALCQNGAVTQQRTLGGQTRFNVAGIKKDGMSYTPSAVDAIRVFTWPQMIAGTDKKTIVADLISQGFNKGTVRARVKRIFDGTDESCFNEEIRARLGLDELELDEEDEVEDEE
jgi:hypothetical protein